MASEPDGMLVKLTALPFDNAELRRAMALTLEDHRQLRESYGALGSRRSAAPTLVPARS
jgi:hypothetical protein